MPPQPTRIVSASFSPAMVRSGTELAILATLLRRVSIIEGVVGSVVGYHGSLEILFQAAHAVHRALGARDGPCAGEVLADALVWLPFRGKLLVGDERHFDFGILALSSGTRRADEPLAMNASVRRITGVVCSIAMRAASKAIWKQSVGDTAESTHIGDSPLRP